MPQNNAPPEGPGHTLHESNQPQTEFVSLVAHELRTPLTAIKGYVELLLEDADGLGEEQREFLGLIKTNTDRLVELISDLVDITRLEAGRVTLQRTALHISSLLQTVVQTLQPQLAAKRQRLTVDCASSLPAIAGDTARVTQVLTILLSKASQTTPPEGDISVTAQGNQSHVRIDVHDTGPGFSPEEQAQLFTPFFRGPRHLSPHVREVSLGLALARTLVEMHSGVLTIVSVPGQGSTVILTLPALSEQQDSVASDPYAPSGQ